MRSTNQKIFFLKALNSLLENSIRRDHNSPSTGIVSDGEKLISVQPAFHGLTSDQENIDLNGSFGGAQTHPNDSMHLRP